jgi:hypothetical protein
MAHSNVRGYYAGRLDPIDPRSAGEKKNLT